MVRQYLLPWTIHHCDEETYDGMGWVDRQKGIFFLDWTRQGNTGWVPSDAARAWSAMKGHLKKKKPRDLKAGLRNAYRSKKKELIKVPISKEDSERDGRKRVLWKFLNLEHELEKIFNPASKVKQNKKPVIKKSQQELKGLVKEISMDSNSSTSLDCQFLSMNSKGADAKGKFPKKRGRRSKKTNPKQSEVATKLSPPVRSLISRRNLSGSTDDAYLPPLQSQVISSTISKNPLQKKYKDLASFFEKDIFTDICGPTPPPQATDVVFEDSGETLCTPVSSPRSENILIYSFLRDSPNVSQSDESKRSPNSSSPFYPLWIETFSNDSRNQADESRQSPTSTTSLCPVWNEIINNSSSNQSDESRQSPTSTSPLFPVWNEAISKSSSNQSDESRQSPTSSSLFFPLEIETVINDSINQSMEYTSVRQSPTSSSPSFPLWNETIPNDLQNIPVIHSYDLDSIHSTSTLRPLLQPHQSDEMYKSAQQDRCPSPNQLQGCVSDGQSLGPNETGMMLPDSLQLAPSSGVSLDQIQPSVSENQSVFSELFQDIFLLPGDLMIFNQ
ncbi:hypothetical protein JTE90_005592 [Oedothorax gibbosus]|uniref:IRF tryptophan pentad repeat domain-containing protein n=1 Tax=Oedothorax gibbosus TaxID=931172 RepID=A0AAV6VC66_9ARAC|nr:hypothetical protein JTE90_005592 [Oedothorax gibbosus]